MNIMIADDNLFCCFKNDIVSKWRYVLKTIVLDFVNR